MWRRWMREGTRLLRPLTVFQFAVVPGQAVIWIGVAPGAVLVSVRVPAVVVLQPYMGHCRVRIPTVKHTNTDSHVPFVILHRAHAGPCLINMHTAKSWLHLYARTVHIHCKEPRCVPGKSDSGFPIVQSILCVHCPEPVEGNAEFCEACSWEYESMHSKHSAGLRPVGATSSVEQIHIYLSFLQRPTKIKHNLLRHPWKAASGYKT